MLKVLTTRRMHRKHSQLPNNSATRKIAGAHRPPPNVPTKQNVANNLTKSASPAQTRGFKNLKQSIEEPESAVTVSVAQSAIDLTKVNESAALAEVVSELHLSGHPTSIKRNMEEREEATTKVRRVSGQENLIDPDGNVGSAHTLASTNLFNVTEDLKRWQRSLSVDSAGNQLAHIAQHSPYFDNQNIFNGLTKESSQQTDNTLKRKFHHKKIKRRFMTAVTTLRGARKFFANSDTKMFKNKQSKASLLEVDDRDTQTDTVFSKLHPTSYAAMSLNNDQLAATLQSVDASVLHQALVKQQTAATLRRVKSTGSLSTSSVYDNIPIQSILQGLIGQDPQMEMNANNLGTNVLSYAIQHQPNAVVNVSDATQSPQRLEAANALLYTQQGGMGTDTPQVDLRNVDTFSTQATGLMGNRFSSDNSTSELKLIVNGTTIGVSINSFTMMPVLCLQYWCGLRNTCNSNTTDVIGIVKIGFVWTEFRVLLLMSVCCMKHFETK